ncbi:hypothetical protein CKAN_01194600 [Cinnamomum micranthum f. kanehirae]|uniref:AT-rich interactive domain-containing protein 2 n=1 Tax=Cinnamomum micranthum f. kanehirae TaxID=337451 RepID=A0A443NXD5_9MAGN|nr:hypothetical protein CKAN_01194600 [Cinnamomum micranthum f. kanehirae]
MPHLSFGTLLVVLSSSRSVSQFRSNFKGTSVIEPLCAGIRVSALLTPRFQFGPPATKTQALVLFSSSWFSLLPNSISIFLSDLRIDLGFDFVSFPSIDRAQFLPFPLLLRDSSVRLAPVLGRLNMVCKNNKRPSSEYESCGISFKHPRQLDCPSFVRFDLCNNSSEKPQKSVSDGGVDDFKGEETLVSRTISELFVADDKEFESCAWGSISGLSWVTSSTSEEDAISEPTLQVSWSPGVADNVCPSRMSVESEETLSSLASHPHRKLVSIGPDHQADVPVWASDGAKKATSYFLLATQSACDSDAGVPFPPSLSVPSSHIMLDDKEEQLVGTCVIPMPEADSSGYASENLGHGRVECSCLDEGSIRCVRQHVKEVREKLLVTLGQERFVGLGFCDMGEDVALKWIEEDEQVFHDIVFSNPASLGKNFWDHLSEVFPTKTMKDLVSYYFNAFILQIRAQQNRRDPLNIDSDNDEWEASDDGEEFATTEEDEDSALESPANQGKTVYSEDSHDNYHEDDDEVSEGGAGNLASVEDDVGGLDNVSGVQVSGNKSSSFKPFVHRNFIPTDHYASNELQNGSEEQDVPDESCTSYECQHSPSDTTATQEQSVDAGPKILHGECGDGSLFGMVDHGDVFESCDASVWDIEFFTGTKNDFDFLPTHSLIEEIFGDEMWNDDDDPSGSSTHVS